METNEQQQAPQGTFIDTDEWIPIHTLTGFASCIEYFINRKGEVKSTKGDIEKILRHQFHPDGYPMVKLTQRIGRKLPITVCIHKLVAFAFLGQPPTPYGNGPGQTLIHHIDEDKANCHVDNLEWKSRGDNNNAQPYRRFNGHARPGLSPEERQTDTQIRNAEYMRKRREDPEFKEKEAQEQRDRRPPLRCFCLCGKASSSRYMRRPLSKYLIDDLC